MTVIKILVEQFRPVIWRVRNKQSNDWRKILPLRRLIRDFLREWDDDTRFLPRSLWYPVSFAGGAAVYFTLSTEPGLTAYACSLVLMLAGFAGLSCAHAAYQPVLKFCFLVWFWGVAGFSYAGIRTHSINASPLPSQYDKVMAEGWIERIETSPERTRITLRVHAISNVETYYLPERIRLTQRLPTELTPGRFVRCFSQVNPPPEPVIKGDYEFHRDAFFRRLGGVGFVYGSCKPGAIPVQTGVLRQSGDALNKARQDLARNISDAAGPKAGGLAAALLTGDRSYLKPEDQETLRATGLAHLLAISGLHMGLAGGAFYFLFFGLLRFIEPVAKRWPVQKPAALAALAAVTAYLFLSGMSISAQRAYVMVAAGFIAIVTDRPVLSLQTIGLSMSAVVLISPSAVVTPGFQMSFAAAAALIKAYSLSNRSLLASKAGLIRRHLVPILLTSVVAGVATMPFAIYHFGRPAPLGILVNFIVMPVFTFISVPLAVLSAIAMVAGHGGLPLHWFGLSLSLILEIADWFASYEDGAQSVFLEKPFGNVPFLLCCAALVMWILSAKYLPKRSLIAVTLAYVLWLMSPTSPIIISGTGHLAIKTNAGWKTYQYAPGGLRPLMFSGLEAEKCLSGCRFPLKNGAALEVNEDQITLTQPGDNPTDIMVSGTSWRIVDRQSGFDLISVSPESCRPWNTNWTSCHRNKKAS